MNCHICHRSHHAKRLPFYCVVDARNELYELRLANARVLLEKEEIGARVDNLISATDSSADAPPSDTSSRLSADRYAAETRAVRDETDKIIAAADKLRDEVAAARRDIEKRKAAIALKKSDLATASQGTTARRERLQQELKTNIRTTKYHWDREYDAMAQYRAALCAEVAKLYRLQRVQRKNPVRFEYKIGAIDIIDLNQLNNAQPELISTSLSHLTHLLWLTSHYLAIRLPAEITLPHNDYPRPTIFTLASSYHHEEVAFPGTSPLPTDAGENRYTSIPRPRPLFVDRALPTLAKEDHATYRNFIEGICLLAYDIAWLCRSQGVVVGDSFEDFAALGRNMYNLLLLQKNNDGQQTHGSDTTNNGAAAPRMGLYSHGTAHTPFPSGSNTSYESNPVLNRAAGSVPHKMANNPVKLADALRARLAAETSSAAAAAKGEWEIVDDVFSGDEDESSSSTRNPASSSSSQRQSGGVIQAGPKLGETVLVGRAREGEQRYGLMDSVMSVHPSSGTGGNRGTSLLQQQHQQNGGVASSRPGINKDKEREKGTSGWTKIKPR